MNKTLRDLLILAIVFGGIWAGIAYLPIVWKAPDLTISKEQEQKLGDILAEKSILAEWENINNQYPMADSAIRIITRRLLNQIDTPGYNYRFYLLRDSTINAFTIAGGHIFIFEGLLKFCETPEELAAVLAHEIGHAEKRHIAKKLTKELGLTLITTILGGGNDNMAKEAGKILLSKGFDRKYEEEADQYSINMLEKAGISPYKLASFFRRLDENGLSYNKNLEFMMTHPHHDTRVKDILSHQTPAKFKEIPFKLDWEGVKKSLDE